MHVSGVGVGPLEERDLGDAVALVTAQQNDPTRHVGYLSLTADAITAELTQLAPAGLAGHVLATRDERVVGLLGAEWDHAPPRVWWYGPFVTEGPGEDAIADALYAAARLQLPTGVSEQELAPDDRNRFVAAFARRHGFVPEEASAALRHDLATPLPDVAVPDVRIGPLSAADGPAIAALHDALFGGTHTPGDRLSEGRDRHVLVATGDDGRAVGYVAVERHEDGSGYVDFLGVAPDVRGRGIASALVVAGARRLVERHACHEVHLTVRESNVAARALYERLGFAEERLLRPWRLGFTLDREPALSGEVA